MLAHERCGRHLYRSCEGRTNNPILQAKYRELGEETEQHVEILEQLITASGGNPSYVGPKARAVLGTDTNLVQSTFLLEGSLDIMTAEMSMLDAVFLAESVDHANWKLFIRLTETMPNGELRNRCEEAVRWVEPQEDEHLTWAEETKQRLTMLQASGDIVPAVGAKAEEMIARVRNWLAD
jgi:rubrerythrin